MTDMSRRDTTRFPRGHSRRTLGLRYKAPSAERGAVLIVAMILLVVLTLLGLTTMNTTSLEEKMAANSQEFNRAFQTAESGLSLGFNDANPNAWSLSDTDDGGADDYNPPESEIPVPAGAPRIWVNYNPSFKGWSPPPTYTLYSATSFRAANFNFQSTGATGAGGTGVTVQLNGGAFQIAPLPN